jgi:putative oxidoreductase
MTNTIGSAAELLARIALSVIFLMSGIGKIMDWSGTAATMERHGMVAVPFFLGCAILCEIVGGLGLLAGLGTRGAAGLLFVFLIPTTLIFHDFWNYDGPRRMEQTINFLKNLAVLGGLLKFVADGAGAYSVDAWRARSADGGERALTPEERGMVFG